MSKAVDQKKLLIAAVRARAAAQRRNCFDGANLNSRPSGKQVEILQDVTSPNLILRAGNQSGKSSLKIRDYVWKLEDTHPYWQRRNSRQCPHCKSTQVQEVNPAIKRMGCRSCGQIWVSWENEQLIFLCIMQTNKMTMDLWERKMKSLITKDVTPCIQNGVLQHVYCKETNTRIYFFSHENAMECRKRIQYYDAHDAWIDEMPSDFRLFEEAKKAVRTKMGQFSATFTPKVKNEDIKNSIDNADPLVTKVYRLHTFDNPANVGREKEIIASYAGYPQEIIDAGLRGDWTADDDLMLYFDEGRLEVPLPLEYEGSWHHVEVVDPAASSKTGYMLFAKEPTDTNTWYCVKAKYIDGCAPSKLIVEVDKESRGCNIVLSVYDPHENWYRKEFSEKIEEKVVRDRKFSNPWNKTQRKKELLKAFEQSLFENDIKYVKDECDSFKSEIGKAKEDPNKPGYIHKSSQYHLIDSIQYFLDCKPEYTKPPKLKTAAAEFRAAWVDVRMKRDKEKAQKSKSEKFRSRWTKHGNHKISNNRWR